MPSRPHLLNAISLQFPILYCTTMDSDYQVLANGFPCFNEIVDGEHSHAVIISGGYINRGGYPSSNWSIPYWAISKRTFPVHYHAFKMRKYAQRYFSIMTYRFNRRFNLSTLPMGLLCAPVNAQPQSADSPPSGIIVFMEKKPKEREPTALSFSVFPIRKLCELPVWRDTHFREMRDEPFLCLPIIVLPIHPLVQR